MANTYTPGNLAVIDNYYPAAVAGINPQSIPAGIYRIVGSSGTNVTLVDLGSGHVATPVTIPQAAVLNTYAAQ